MAGPLLETKLYVPRRRRGLVPRPRLSERLSRGAESTLTLVSAPAGFGKTTLLAEWLAAAPADGRSAAWLSLDQRDNDPASFWTYLIAALQTVAPGVGAGALALLQSPQPPIEAVLATLLNDLGAVPNDVVLVLDDYHVIDARDVQDGMAFLLEHLPPQMHLVIASRADPALPLARLRARGELVEIRAADLRFTPDEAAAYLNEVMGLELTAQDVAALEGRTEGWIAALQLAALSMQGRDDVAGFIAGFAGDDRYIVDYLVEEVCSASPSMSGSFLLQTSILDRLSGPLCDAVTGQDGGKAMLEALERGNLFLVPLDDRRHWYRYHHLFADVLQAHLLDEQPDHVPELHRRASDVVRAERRAVRGDPPRAGRRGLRASGGPGRAGDPGACAGAGRRPRCVGWLEALPDEVVRVRPVLSVGVCRGVAGQRRARGRRGAPAGRRAVAGHDDRRPCGTGGPVGGDGRRGRRGVSPPPGDDRAVPRRAGPGSGRRARHRAPRPAGARPRRRGRPPRARRRRPALLGLASWTSGDLEAAHRAYAEGMARLQRAGHLADVLGCAIALADIRIAQGRLGEAMRTYEQALQLAAEQGGPVLRGTADMYVGHERAPPRAQRPGCRHAAPAAQPGAGRARRVAAEPVSLAGRDGSDPGGRGRSGRRARPARRGGAPVRG